MQPYWRAFAELHRHRPTGFGPSPIPVVKIAAWLDLHQVHGLEDRLEYLDLIGVLDTEWLAWAVKRKEEKGKANADTKPRD